MHEGNRGKITREDGSQDEITFQRHSAASDLNDLAEDDYEHFTWNDVIQRVAAAGREMGSSMARHMFATIESITKQTGNRVDMEGKPTPEKFFTLLRKIEISFDVYGQPEWPVMVGDDIANKAIRSILEQIERTPELRKELKSIISEKREQWRDSESCRKLVG